MQSIGVQHVATKFAPFRGISTDFEWVRCREDEFLLKPFLNPTLVCFLENDWKSTHVVGRAGGEMDQHDQPNSTTADRCPFGFVPPKGEPEPLMSLGTEFTRGIHPWRFVWQILSKCVVKMRVEIDSCLCTFSLCTSFNNNLLLFFACAECRSLCSGELIWSWPFRYSTNWQNH